MPGSISCKQILHTADSINLSASAVTWSKSSGSMMRMMDEDEDEEEEDDCSWVDGSVWSVLILRCSCCSCLNRNA